MILSGAQLTALRSHPGKMQFYLGVHDRSSYCSCQVNNPSAAKGDMTIPYDHVTWSTNPSGGAYTFADVPPNVTCYLASTFWSDMGRVRVKSMDADNIYVAENEDLAWADDMWLLIEEVHQPWARYPRVTAVGDVVTVYQDYDLPYVSLADANRPVPIMGPPVAGFLDGTPATFTAYFDGNNSYGLDGAHIDSWSWKFPGGTPATSAVATPGDVHWHGFGTFVVELTVTDSNGKSSTGYRSVFVYSDRKPALVGAYPYGDFEVNSLEGDDGGWRASFTVRVDPSLVTSYPVQLWSWYFRDDAEVILFAEGDAGNDTALPIPGNDQKRASVLFFGYVVGETIVRDPETSQVSFEVAGICDRMRMMEQFSDTLETAAAPAQWYEFDEGLTVDLAVLYHLRWRSTILEIADVYPTGKMAKRIMRQDFTQGNLHSQCQQLLDAIQAKMISDKQGSIYMRVDPQVLPSGAERNAVDSIFTLNDSTDWREELTFERRKLSAVGLIDLAGVSYAGGLDPDTDVIPILSLAPGNTPMYEGSLIEKVDGLVLESQAQANQLSGDILAWRNNEFPTIRIPMAGPWTPLDVAPPSWLTWTMALNATKRGIFWTAARFLIRSVSIQCSNETGEASVDIAVEKEADGADGIDGNYPPTVPEEPTSPVPVEPPIPPVPPTPGPGVNGSWRKNVLALTASHVYYTPSFVSGAGPGGVPVWEVRDTGLPSPLNGVDLVFDPVTPELIQYVLADGAVYRCTAGIATSWSVCLTAAQAAAVVGDARANPALGGLQTSSGSRALFVTLVTGATSVPDATRGHYYMLWSNDYGATWAGALIVDDMYRGGISTPTISFMPDCTTIYVALRTNHTRIYRSNDSGLTWVLTSAAEDAFYSSGTYIDPCYANIVYWPRGSANLYRSADSGASWAVCTYSGGNISAYSTIPGPHWMNSQFVQAGLARVANLGLFKSLNNGATWVYVAPATYQIDYVELAPDAPDKLYTAKRGAADSNVYAQDGDGGVQYVKNGVNPTNIPLGANLKMMTPIWTLE